MDTYADRTRQVSSRGPGNRRGRSGWLVLLGAATIAVTLGWSVGLPAAATTSAPATADTAPAGIHTSSRPCAPGMPGAGCVVVTAHGFDPGRQVLVRQYHRQGWQSIQRADRRGAVSIDFVALGATGNRSYDAQRSGDVLTFVEVGRNAAVTPNVGNVSVGVPRIAVYRATGR